VSAKRSKCGGSKLHILNFRDQNHTILKFKGEKIQLSSYVNKFL